MSCCRKIKAKRIMMVKRCSRPFKFYDFCEEHFGSSMPLRRILAQARTHKANTLVCEEISKSSEIKREDQDLCKRVGKRFKGSNVFRLSFFKKRFQGNDISNVSRCDNEDFLGYAIIKENLFGDDSEFNIFESVLLPSKFPHNYIHTKNSFEVRIAGRNFNISGSVYCEQNGLTNVCAHAALRTLLSSKGKDKIATNHEINDILGIDHITDQLGPGRGLRDDEIVGVIKASGLDHFGLKKYSSKYPFHHYIYSSVESGYTALLGFETKDSDGEISNHLVPVIGHTFNQDAWVPNAEQWYFKIGKAVKYFPSVAWASSFIIHDDNFGSYYCLPIRYITNRTLKFALGTIRSRVKPDPIDAELIAERLTYEIIKVVGQHDISNFRWLQRFCIFCKKQQIVIRTILLKKEDYILHLRNSKSWTGKRFDPGFIDYCIKHLPNDFWCSELSVPDLYATNNRKLGEIILCCDKPLLPSLMPSWEHFICARLPACFVIPENNKFRFYLTNILDHIPLYPY